MKYRSFQKFCKKSKIKLQSKGIFKIFSKGVPERISIYELLAGIILFSSLTWQQKVALGFSLFDFDNDLQLNKDELQMMLLAYTNSIFTLTQLKIDLPDIYETLEKSEDGQVHMNK